MPKYITAKPVNAKAVTQIECFKQHPELALGMPIPLDELTRSFDEIAVVEAEQQQLKKSLALATKRVQRARWVMREKLRANLAIAALRHGPASEAIVLMGGKPRGGGSVKRNGIEEGVPGPASPVP